MDFEFRAEPGERQEVHCLCARELGSNRLLKFWRDELDTMPGPPYSTDRDSLFIAYYASAELGCHMSLGWPMPVNVLDLYVEFKNNTNGLEVPCGYGLLGALTAHGLNGIDALDKDTMRALAIRGGPFTNSEKMALLTYCQSDVDALQKLLPRMEPFDIGRALLRGNFMKAAATMEFNGVPLNQTRLAVLKDEWPRVQDSLIARIDENYGVFDGRTFKVGWFADWLRDVKIPWPLLPGGRLDLEDETFRQMARVYPQVAPLRELRSSLSQMRLAGLAVGRDGRNRTMLSAFKATSSRNLPSNSKFIFGPSVWLRGLIQPEPGHGLAYIDWSQQEFGIAAALSGDENMMRAYLSGDPYLAFAVQAAAAPPDATKHSHGAIRDLFKDCALGVQYGMSEVGLALKINRPAIEARRLLDLHHRTYSRFWEWSDGVVDYGMLHSRLWTVFGWNYQVGPKLKPRTLRNFPMQANGAEMLRLACCYAIQRGVKVCAPVHDAIMIEAPVEDLELAIEKAQQAMADASAAVLSGFRLRSDASAIRYPDHYSDPRGVIMWETFWSVVADKAKVEIRDDSRAGMRLAIKKAAIEARDSKRREIGWRKAAVEILADNTIYAFINDIYRRGGFKYSALVVDFGAETIRELNRKRPGLLPFRSNQLESLNFGLGDERL